MNRYQSYKPSGVEWIGEIPEEWSIMKLGYLGKLKSGNGFSENLQGREIGGDFPFFKVSDTNNEGNEMYLVRGNNYVSNDDYIENKWYLFPKLTVVFPKIGMVLLMNKRRILNQPSFIDNNMMGFIPNSHIQFLFSFYLLKLIDFKNYCSDGTVPSIGENQISSIKVVIPPLKEQTQIVQFLDEKTELIDKLISTKERKITLLKEQRTSLINQIVTKGLNPNVKMKDSGVEWIGEIPEMWIISKLKYNGFFFSGYSFDSGDFISEGEIRVIKISNIQNNGISWDDLSFVPTDFYDKFKNFIVQKGDLIFVLTRPIISTGIKICFYDEDYKVLLNQRNSVYRPNSIKLNKIFTYYLVRTMYFFEEFKQQLKETNQPNISTEQISNIKIFLPPIEEQLQIVEFLDFKTKEVDDLVQLEQKKIDLLKEYRQSLISEVVTGKIKVTINE